MAEVDLGQVKMTDAELMNFILQFNGGVRLGKDENGNAGYITTDEETGADTVIPFSSGGGGFEGGDILVFSGGSSTSTGTLVSNSYTAEVKRDYKKVLFLALYFRTDTYNTLQNIEMWDASGATYNPEEEWACDNLSSGYTYYIKASLRGEVKSGEKIGFMARATISNTAKTTKYLLGVIIGLY